ncbi:MAG: phage holin family protein [Pseudomonadota bacterium]|nr:phage holin family protein [Pseudomonadota bacterium]
MSYGLSGFLLQWAVSSFSLWIASYLFSGIRFADGGSLLVAALLLGVVNALVRPLLILLTLPLTLLTLGTFLLVINAMMLLLVSWLVRGFSVSGFWTALFASLFISFMGSVLTATLDRQVNVSIHRGPPDSRPGDWL